MSDPTKPQLTITVSCNRSGLNPYVAEIIQEALSEAGFPVLPSPDHGPFRPKSYQRVGMLNAPTIQIVEVQS